MTGARPEQAQLTRDNDLSKTNETLATIDAMVDGLHDHDIADMGRFFSETQKEGSIFHENQFARQLFFDIMCA